jgi:3-hydroxyisobutyrate dehydrogenase
MGGEVTGSADGRIDVGLIGVGVMGSAMASALTDSYGGRLALRCFDIRPDAPLPPGATRCQSAADAAAGSAVVIVSVTGPPEVGTAVLHPDHGALRAMTAGSVLVDTTTSSLEMCREVAAACKAKGIGFLDAPVTGRPPAMTMLVGGDASALDQARPVLDAIAAQVRHLGPTGAGCVAKLVNQLLIYGNFLTMCEGLALAAKADVGIDLAAAVAAWRTGGADSSSLARLSDPVLGAHFAEARGAPLDIVAKDMRLLAELAEAVGVSSAVAAELDRVFAQAQSLGFGQQYFAAASKVIEAEAGTELRGHRPGTDPAAPDG